jgi:thioredoxin-related protein
MLMEKQKSPLDTIANIAIILVCIIAAAVLIDRNVYKFLPMSTQRQPGAPPEAAKGDTFAALRDVIPAGTQKALVVAVSPTCHFCNDSMPFYKQLIDKRNESNSPVKVIAAVPGDDAKEAEAKHFADAGTQPDAMVHVDFSTIKVPGTPTLLLVDNQGKVLDVWVGKLDPDREREVLAKL